MGRLDRSDRGYRMREDEKYVRTMNGDVPKEPITVVRGRFTGMDFDKTYRVTAYDVTLVKVREENETEQEVIERTIDDCADVSIKKYNTRSAKESVVLEMHKSYELSYDLEGNLTFTEETEEEEETDE